jgi:hypothetical protein
MPSPLPRQLRILARVGILFGSLSAMYALFNAETYLVDRGKFVSAFRYRDESLRPSPAPNSSERAEKVADKFYTRRGVILPLAAVNFILSLLLAAGCLRTLGGSAWGLSAFRLACVGSIPYQVLNGISLVLETRDLAPILGESPRPMLTFVVLWTALWLGYYGWCLVYLRRPQISALFR